MPAIRDSYEAKRGCGFRKPGGMYLVGGEVSKNCGKLPVLLSSCPTCGSGIKVCRGWQWVNADLLIGAGECDESDNECRICPLGGYYKMGRAGMLWVGEKFYSRPVHFLNEAARMGVSRRIKQIPREFKVGETWVLLAHRSAMVRSCVKCTNEEGERRGSNGHKCSECEGAGEIGVPGIFSAFRPQRIEYVVTGKETADELEALEERGLSLVRVHRVTEKMAESDG